MTGPSPEVVGEYIRDTRERARHEGRDPQDLLFFMFLKVITGGSEAEARHKYDNFLEYVDYEGGLALLGGWTGVDFSRFDADQPVEYIETNAIRSILQGFTQAGASRRWTIRDVAKAVGIGGRSSARRCSRADRRRSLCNGCGRARTGSTSPTWSPRAPSRISSTASFQCCNGAGSCKPITQRGRSGRSCSEEDAHGCSIDILPHGIADGEIVHHTRVPRAHEPRFSTRSIPSASSGKQATLALRPEIGPQTLYQARGLRFCSLMCSL